MKVLGTPENVHSDEFDIKSENGMILERRIIIYSPESISNLRIGFQFVRLGNAFWEKNMLGKELDTVLGRRIAEATHLIPFLAVRTRFRLNDFADSQI
jgi:hypothetical protein